MTPDEGPDLERAGALMMAALDGECTPGEREELDALLEKDAEIRLEWARLTRLKEVTSTMAMREPPEEVWDRFTTSVFHRAERGIAWMLIAAGAVVLAGWGAWRWTAEVLGATALPLVVRGAVVLVAVGAVALLLSVVRERWVVRRGDPYSKGVTR